jgi:hypothetical protein
MNQIPENPLQANRLLSDEEFARLMIAEYGAERRKKGFLSYRQTQLQTVLWAASLLFFIVIPEPENLSADEEFSFGPQERGLQNSSGNPDVRSKSGARQNVTKPVIDAEFSIVGPETSESYSQESPDLVAVQVKTQGVHNLKVEVHENGKLKIIRKLDPLTPPLEQFNQVTVRGLPWRYALEIGTATLICIKPAGGNPPPERLSPAEMIGRSEKFRTQCFYRSL